MARSADSKEDQPKKSKLPLILGGVGCGVIGLLACCCGLPVFWTFYPWNGVYRSEKDIILESHALNRGNRPEDALVYDLWDGDELIDHAGQKARVVRVKYHTIGNPNRFRDRLWAFRNGRSFGGAKNRWGDDWRTGAKGLDWEAQIGKDLD
jgi:hypothetical protein